MVTRTRFIGFAKEKVGDYDANKEQANEIVWYDIANTDMTIDNAPIVIPSSATRGSSRSALGLLGIGGSLNAAADGRNIGTFLAGLLGSALSDNDSTDWQHCFIEEDELPTYSVLVGQQQTDGNMEVGVYSLCKFASGSLSFNVGEAVTFNVSIIGADVEQANDLHPDLGVISSKDLFAFEAATDIITRAEGDFIEDGFVEKTKITVSGSVSNNVTYTIATGGVAAQVITLDEEIVDETTPVLCTLIARNWIKPPFVFHDAIAKIDGTIRPIRSFEISTENEVDSDGGQFGSRRLGGRWVVNDCETDADFEESGELVSDSNTPGLYITGDSGVQWTITTGGGGDTATLDDTAGITDLDWSHYDRLSFWMRRDGVTGIDFLVQLKNNGVTATIEDINGSPNPIDLKYMRSGKWCKIVLDMGSLIDTPRNDVESLIFKLPATVLTDGTIYLDTISVYNSRTLKEKARKVTGSFDMVLADQDELKTFFGGTGSATTPKRIPKYKTLEIVATSDFVSGGTDKYVLGLYLPKITYNTIGAPISGRDEIIQRIEFEAFFDPTADQTSPTDASWTQPLYTDPTLPAYGYQIISWLRNRVVGDTDDAPKIIPY